jgi:hypothetical protein
MARDLPQYLNIASSFLGTEARPSKIKLTDDPQQRLRTGFSRSACAAFLIRWFVRAAASIGRRKDPFHQTPGLRFCRWNQFSAENQSRGK